MMCSDSLLPINVLCDAVAGSVIAGCAEKGRFSSVVTDSRTVTPGSLFVPLIGQEQDGHHYIPQALENGAAVIFVSDKSRFDYVSFAQKYACVFIFVNNTLYALQQAARAYLDTFPQLIKIGITGSSGKTTTKEILGSILSQNHAVIMNEGNLNSETGLPLSVFRVRPHHEIGIFEAGMNRCHELEELSAVLRPHFGIITNVGTAHIGILGSRDAIAKEKRSLFSHFTASDTGFVYENDDYAAFLMRDTAGTVKTFGLKTTPHLISAHDKGLDGTDLVFANENGKELCAHLPLPGPYNALNACAAASVAFAMGESVETICSGISCVKPLFGRSQRIEAGGITFILDCYNANPDSMERSLDFCDSVQWPGRKIYIIGSMLELGDAEIAEHKKLGSLLANSHADMIFMYGDPVQYAADVVAQSEHRFLYTCDAAELAQHVMSECTSGDFVFVKGSRGCALEFVVQPVIDAASITEVRH